MCNRALISQEKRMRGDILQEGIVEPIEIPEMMVCIDEFHFNKLKTRTQSMETKEPYRSFSIFS